MNPVHRQELPPLENPLILEVVFKYCSVADLKVCRQVSKVWQDSSLMAWRSSVKVSIGIGDGRRRRRMSEFLDFVQNESSNHFECPFVTNYAVYEHAPEFWDTCGFSVETLALRGFKIQSVDVFRSVIFESCPNLENLTLKIDTISDLPSVLEEPTEFLGPQFGEQRKLKSLTVQYATITFDRRHFFSWMELLSYFPSLETLRIDGPIPNYNGLFRSLNLIRQYDCQKLQLKHVYINQDISNSLFLVLQDPRLAIVSLEVHVVSSDHAIEVQKILKIHASSLKTLSLIGHDPVDLRVCFLSLSRGKLVNLQHLQLLDSLHPSLLTMGFLKFTPNLRTLAMDYFGSHMEGSDASEMAGVNLPQCKELTMWRGASVTEDQFVEYLSFLAKWIPNLETLTTNHLGNRTFAAVCAHWPNIVSLKVYSSNVDDCGLTGLDLEDVARINEGGLIGTWRPITVPRANITALKRLQNFYMRAPSAEPELGICSALCGILQLPQLRQLTLELNVNGGFEPQNPNLWKAARDRLL